MILTCISQQWLILSRKYKIYSKWTII